jgi:nitrite reductase/ring-hydroxylating ferredoxin subunit
VPELLAVHAPAREQEGGSRSRPWAIVTCPWHGWRYDVTTGARDENPSVRVACYAVTVENGVVYVEC